ncbi:hypothetical protein OG21DRAFT_1491231 [Imleria badia]|nr:hypothetical protein OG21DRAFT_1491231 [Imleria badia]
MVSPICPVPPPSLAPCQQDFSPTAATPPWLGPSPMLDLLYPLLIMPPRIRGPSVVPKDPSLPLVLNEVV